MPTISEELMIFLIAVISGGTVRLVYQAVHVFRKIFTHRLWLIHVEDLVFWTGTAIYLFVQIYHTSNGSIRWYFVLGVVVGAVIFTLFLKKSEKVFKKFYILQNEK